jgi:putative DNA primase/helicase
MRPGTKAPALDTWKEYASRRQTEEEVQAMAWTAQIGIVNGINNIRTADLDDCDDPDTAFKFLTLLGLDFEYQWIVETPGGGFHIHFECPDQLTLTPNGVLVGYPRQDGDGQAFKQIELRWHDCLTVFPYSSHPDSKEKYDWLYPQAPQTPMAVIPGQVVERAFLTLATMQKPEPEQEKRKLKYDPWAAKALDQELSILRDTEPGQRNNQLNRSAYNLGQICGAGMLDEEDIRSALTRAAAATGLTDSEIAATIESGINAGSQKPRMPKQVYKANEPKSKLAPVRTADDEKLASFSADDQGHAEAVYHLFGPYLAHNDAYGWMIWNGTHFVPSVQRINTIIVEVLRMRQRAAAHMERPDLAKVSKANAGQVNATRAMLENLAFIHVDEFDSEPDMINTANGVVNLKTKKLMKHSPAYHFTWCCSVGYKPGAISLLWTEFLHATVSSPTANTQEIISYLQEAMGYSITGNTSEEILFYIFGPPRSGKGTMSETILSIFPRPIAIEVDFNTFTAKREGDTQNFDLAPMKPARLVFASESNKYQTLNPAKIKALTGGNEISCAFKHRDTFTYKPQYSVWLSSNHEVNADADDDALWGRLRVVNFPNSRLGKEDKSLKRHMQQPDNLEAVLAWIIEGAYLWYQHQGQGLQTPQSVIDFTNRQRDDQDSIKLWLEECCETDSEAWSANTSIRLSYEKWCKDNGYEPKKANSLARSLTAHHLKVGVQRRVTYTPGSSESEKVRGVAGLRVMVGGEA